MQKDALVILGNSLFITQVNVWSLLERYPVYGFNGIGQHYPVDAVFCFDRWFDPGKAKLIFHPAHVKPPAGCTNSQPFEYRANPKPLLPAGYKNGLPLLAFKYFSPSVALNWGLLQGFKRIYLVGIDNVESDTRFAHHDGATCRSELTPKAHQAFKEYVYNCAQHAEIFQCNPAVRDGWRLPFMEIERLYEPS